MITQRLLVLCLIAGSTLDIPALVGQEISENGPSYLLLQNGNVLKGLVRYEKERLSVAADGNSHLFIAPKQVLFVGPTLESLYQYQRSSVRQWGTGEHWQLAHWCIQQELLPHAIEHFKVLEQSAKDSPRFKQLEHALREALSTDQHVQQLLQSRMQSEDSPAITPTQPSEAPTQPSEALAQPSKALAQPSKVVQASAVMPNLKSMQQPRNEIESTDSWNKHEIPSYIRKTFQNSILPILVSRCGQSGCHGMLGKSDFHLYQPLGEKSSILLTRDLDEVLKYIDRDHIQESVLLTYATKAHGIQRNPSLSATRTDERVLIERIQFWVKSLALSKMPESTMPVTYPTDSVGSPEVTSAVASVPTSNLSNRKSRRFTEAEEDRDAKLSKPARSASPTEFLSMSEIAELEQAIEKFEKKTGGADSSSNRKDPFASDVFNRKYR